MLPAGSPLSAWLTWLETLHPKEIELGLERVRDVLGRLPLQRPEHVFLIAGTNGKGSSVAMTDALLRAAGLHTGVYTSPHILDYNERIAVNGTCASDSEIVAAFETVESARQGVSLTYFEYSTLAALVVFSAADLDAWVLEVGMGGRLDATNAIEPTAALITNVALDHCDWLGEDIDTIAVEKAGVMRPDIPVVYGSTEVPRTVVAQAEKVGAKLLLRGRDFTLEGVPQPGLAGDFQIGNAAAVLAMLGASGIAAATAPELVAKVLPQVQLAGRGQRIEQEGTEWLLDVAHNPAAAAALADMLAQTQHDGATTAIIGMLDDKDVEGAVVPLSEHVDRWIAVTADSQRALPAAELARRIANASNRPCLVVDAVQAALDSARRDAGNNDRILVTGSFYLVGPVLNQLRLYSRPQK
ncbi:MAG: bifunctional folylpolyglutamate synthase/dihydrofolate synthase [Gammaproteobacteria bacterium]|nr:bifunctional folylpolyglutamate synthase/dihydrofolate synthase [Gammaproteobacteria bacterium]